MSATQFVYIGTADPISEVAEVVSGLLGVSLATGDNGATFVGALDGTALTLWPDDEGDIDGYVLTVDRHPLGLAGINALARSIYDQLSGATPWRVEVDLPDRTLVRTDLIGQEGESI